jgi:iron(III) transport system permease protein
MRLITAITLLLALPVLGVLGSWAALDENSYGVLAHQLGTVLPGYAWTSFLLSAFVALGVAAVGGVTAATVTLFDFPGRRFFEWALLLPLAMPAYVMAYAYTDFLQYSGPLQSTLRALTGAQGAVLPDVRSLGGAVPMFIFCLYPYVYLLTRAALSERGVHLMEAARLLGAGTVRRVRQVALPLALTPLADGVPFRLMDSGADFGVGASLWLTNFTARIYKV